MPDALTVTSVLLALLLALTAVRKLGRRDQVVESYARVGVPERALRFLALTLTAGAIGVLVGLWWPPLGLMSAAGLVGYFIVAVVFHLRAGEYRTLATPLVYEALALAVLVIHLAENT